MITVEWASSFNRDGTRKKPPPSTIHGWLAKWRGTFLGDERLRNMGLREMREARATRKYCTAKKLQAKTAKSGRSVFSFFTFQSKKPTQFLSRSNHNRGASRGGTARAKQSGRTARTQRSMGHKPSRNSHRPNPRTSASRVQKQSPRQRGH